MRLIRFKVSNFRSVEESDWVDISDNSCLVGTNEAGKTNLLLALWKLNPANRESIVPLDDFPRHLFSNYKANKHSNDVFVHADFSLNEEESTRVANELGCEPEQVSTVYVRRRYDGKYHITFPYSNVTEYPASKVKEIIIACSDIVKSSDSYKKESDQLCKEIDLFFDVQLENTPDEFVREGDIVTLIENAEVFNAQSFGKKKIIPKLFEDNLIQKLHVVSNSFKAESVTSTSELNNRIIQDLPKFVYYSDYGNLDSEIYLPRVIEDFERDDLTESARAKTRTLEVLFKFVNLSPTEIFELGNDVKTIIETRTPQGSVASKKEVELTPVEIQEWADKKRERGILLRSAATQLTTSFKKWWQQGDYIFDFEADGRHFRINVSDGLRPEKIELEGRSRGLQWFFSFFLVFLVETKEGHSNTILLLDEPGLSLHPMAQYDLAKFFRKLSEDNQLLYTSHSPFLVDMENLANVKAVYVDTDTGRTKVSANLRYNEKDADKSLYPVHAALGLTVSDTLLLGCLPILVEGPSDQIYLTLIKRFLIGNGELASSQEIVFIPTGGVRGMGPVTKLVSSRDDSLPYVLLDSDVTGKEYQNSLKNGRYKDEKNKVLGVSEFIGDGDYEIEDLLPVPSMVALIDRMFRADNYFEDLHDPEKPIVDQVESWASNNDIELEKGWKVDVARAVQGRSEQILGSADQNVIENWVKMFRRFTTTS